MTKIINQPLIASLNQVLELADGNDKLLLEAVMNAIRFGTSHIDISAVTDALSLVEMSKTFQFTVDYNLSVSDMIRQSRCGFSKVHGDIQKMTTRKSNAGKIHLYEACLLVVRAKDMDHQYLLDTITRLDTDRIWHPARIEHLIVAAGNNEQLQSAKYPVVAIGSAQVSPHGRVVPIVQEVDNDTDWHRSLQYQLIQDCYDSDIKILIVRKLS